MNVNEYTQLIVASYLCTAIVAKYDVLSMQLSKTVNEVYHTYNRHQSPFVVLDIQTRRGMYLIA